MTAEPKAPRSVLDASALLAYLQKEAGWEPLGSVIARAAISTVNWAEVLDKSIARGVPTLDLRPDLEAAGVQIVPFTAEDAEICAGLLPLTRPLGLGLADRAALALARRLDLPVYTTDRAWTRLSLGVRVRQVR